MANSEKLRHTSATLASQLDMSTGGSLALLDRRIRQPDDHHPRQVLADVDFHLDQHAVETDDRARENLCQHHAPGRLLPSPPDCLEHDSCTSGRAISRWITIGPEQRILACC